MISEDWLKRLNEEFRNAGVDHRGRPWKAIQRYAIEFNTSVDLSSDVATNIFKWFEAHSKPGVQQIGSLYKSVYFYDSEFWIVSILITYGENEMIPLKCLRQMPAVMKGEITAQQKESRKYEIFWADCVDYGMGIEDLKHEPVLNKFGDQLLKSGDQELRDAASLLSQPRPSPRAFLNCRMALEMFFKSYIALKNGLTNDQAKGIGHDLHKGLSKFIKASGLDHFEKSRSILSRFPAIDERYKKQTIASKTLWEGYSLAQSVGAVIVREYTDRNMLEQVMDSNNEN